MIIPSIDLMNGRAVQLVNGKTKKLEAPEDPIALAEKFGRIGEIAVIDLDAAMGNGDNRELIQQMLRVAPCRVGGGIRSYETARDWLNAGARKVILGTQAVPEILLQLPRERAMAAVDMKGGKLAVKGWKETLEIDGTQRIRELRDYVGGFLVTNIDIEGTMQGFDLAAIEPIRDAVGTARLTMAGGITTASDIAALDALGIDAQIGMALYTGALHIADCMTAILKSDRPDGLWPTIVADRNGQALGLVYSNAESLRAAIDEGCGVYHSRRRGLWRKGEESGARQKLYQINMDCDRDALRFIVDQQEPGFCHLQTAGCFGDDIGLPQLSARIRKAIAATDANSYTQKLARNPAFLQEKIREESEEFIEATDKNHMIAEAADLLYFTAVKLAAADIEWVDIYNELDRRAAQITRRDQSMKV